MFQQTAIPFLIASLCLGAENPPSCPMWYERAIKDAKPVEDAVKVSFDPLLYPPEDDIHVGNLFARNNSFWVLRLKASGKPVYWKKSSGGEAPGGTGDLLCLNTPQEALAGERLVQVRRVSGEHRTFIYVEPLP